MTDFTATLNLPRRTRNHKIREQKYTPFFEVIDEEVVGKTSGKSFGNRQLLNAATGKLVGQVSSDYNLVTHKQASDFVKDVLVKAGLEFQSLSARTSTGGSRFFEDIVFPSLAFNPATGSTPSTALDSIGGNGHTFLTEDVHYPRITIGNSYDRTKPLSFKYGMYRLRCTNGLSICLHETQIASFRHNQVVDYEWLKGILISNLEESKVLMQKVFEKLNTENGLEYLCRVLVDGSGFSNDFRVALIDKLNAQDGTFKVDFEEEVDPETGKALKRKYKSITTQQTAYAVYNVMTDLSSHTISNRYEQERMDQRIAKVFIPKLAA